MAASCGLGVEQTKGESTDCSYEIASRMEGVSYGRCIKLLLQWYAAARMRVFV